MSVLFISDLHLAPERPAVTRAFLSFLRGHAAQAEALYILGDLFEAWVGDDDPTELAAQVQTCLGELSRSGVKLYIQHGNRDFLIGQRFIRRCAGELLTDQHIVQHQGQTVLVMHGDSLCTDDVDYQRFRRKARNPIYKWCLSHLPLKRRQKLASDWRAKSMSANSNKASALHATRCPVLPPTRTRGVGGVLQVIANKQAKSAYALSEGNLPFPSR